MKMLVTGGAGFIGSNFIRWWLAERPGDRIINLDLLTYAGDRRSLNEVESDPRYEFVNGDIADEGLVEGVLRDSRPDVIVNFAAESHNSRAVLDPMRFVHTNVVGTQNLLAQAVRAGVQRFHHVSTCEVYGDLALESDESFSEASPYRPRTPYNATKAAADHLVRAYGETFGLPISITNCSNNYGPYQHPEKVIPLFITNALRDLPLPLYRSSDHRREWLHVEDHYRALGLVIERGRIGETYNVGSGDERSIEDIANLVLSTLGKPSSLKTYVEDRPGHDRRYLLDHTKITAELGWRPTIPFEQGLAETVRWYIDHMSWWLPKVSEPQSVDERAWGRS